jgi:hypothetical protein
MATPSRLGHIRHSREPRLTYRRLRNALFVFVSLAWLDLQMSQSEQRMMREPAAAD